MPTFDTGHLFLTFLSPVKTGECTTDLAGMSVSHEQRLRLTLGVLPTALQSPATVRIGRMSPFARNRRNHLCRLFVIETAIFNGRDRQNPIAAAIARHNPLATQKRDELTGPWLAFVADVDAVLEDGEALPATLTKAEQDRRRDAYLHELWRTMEPELREIWGNCLGFERVTDADSFAAYMASCQIETTMPFHDYWIRPPDLPGFDVKRAGIAVAGTLGVALVFGLLGWGVLAALALAVALAVLFRAGRTILQKGNAPMPPADYDDLPSVLKSLYLQQHFTRFVADHQDAAPEALHAAFGRFLDDHKPAQKLSPTQEPGVISADPAMAGRAETAS